MAIVEKNIYMQWRVCSDDYKEIIDNEGEARRCYGRIRKEIKDEEEGRVELFGRSSYEGTWILLQEFELGIDEDEDEDED